MKLSKRIARGIVLPAAIRLQFDRVLLRMNRQKCCIVNFHGVRSTTGQQLNNRHLPVNEFEILIRYFKKNFDVVPLQDIFQIHRNKNRPTKKTIALTFDDGYLNNFEVALPVLEKYQLPATFFIITKCLEDDNFLSWPDIVDILKHSLKTEIEVDGHLFTQPGFFCQEIGSDLLNYLKTTGNRAGLIVQQIAAEHADVIRMELSRSPELFRLVTGTLIRKYSDHQLLEFGSHTHDHPCLAYLTPEEQEMQLKVSKAILQTSCGRPVTSHAFPDGSYNNVTLAAAIAAGYSNLVAVEYKMGEKNANPYLLSRFTVSNSTTAESNILRLGRQFDKFGF